MAKIFQNVQLRTLTKKKRKFLFTIGDTTNSYVGNEIQENNVHFKVHYRNLNDVCVGYSLNYEKVCKVYKTEQYAIVLNGGIKSKPSHIKVLYNDKIVRFLSISGKGFKDYIFLVKNPDNLSSREEEEK